MNISALQLEQGCPQVARRLTMHHWYALPASLACAEMFLQQS